MDWNKNWCGSRYWPPNFAKWQRAWCSNSLGECKANVARVLMVSQPNSSKLSSPTSLSPLTHWFNLSFQQAFVAPQFRSAHVLPVYKSGKRDNYSIYRPISLLSSMCRLQECIVARQLTEYLNKHALLYPLQFGFRGGHSCLHAVLLFLNSLLEGKYDSGGVPKHTIAVFLDLKKAFDTVDHVILLRKLENLGAGCKEVALFRDYLQGRTQAVVINGVTSNEVTMHHPVVYHRVVY